MSANAPCAVAANWPAWRGGAAGSGITTESNLPLKWSDTENIRWRVKLPERGNATPVVWGERVFITQAIEAEHRRTLMCFHRADGRLLWQKGVVYAEPERTHQSNPYCSASPVTDGERVITSFGSAGLVCYDMNGNELWRRDLGKLDHIWGNASSPVIYKNLCIHYHGPAKGAFLTALDKKTGRTLWKFDEPEWDATGRTDGFAGRTNGVVGTWSTPIVVRAGHRDELVLSFPMETIAFDPATGRVLWRCGGLNPLVYNSAIFGEGVVVAMGGYHGNSLAVKAGGEGDVTATRRLWHQVRAKGGIGSGVIKDGRIYFPAGQVCCLELATGKTVWEERIRGTKGGSWSSMLLAGDRIYLPLQSGDIVVVKAGPKFELLAVNSLKEPTNSSLAASNGELFFRTQQTLWCISARKPAPAR
ncbi:MAG: PQQ-like beta-propeller repeat protein [Verrucomicrobiae bacterium]|nr:PQQ-like beta-propeller repeat protein [Verrucomicrobiae bacterium]